MNSLRAGSVEPLRIEKPRRLVAKPVELKRKIKQAEQQLSTATSVYMPEIPSSSKPEVPSPFIMVSDKKMITPGSRDAPKFSSEKPEGLRRFVRMMEDLWKDASVVDDEMKKNMIGKYADQDSEEEWVAFETFKKGHSWDEFKEELIRNYPEAAAAERGTPARLSQLCAKVGKISLGDMESLYSFRRQFMVEAKKLQKPPAAMSNRELVERFIGCLSEALASAVLQYLGNKMIMSRPDEGCTSAGKQPDTKEGVARRPEDRYDLDEVCQAAIQVSENSQGMFSLMQRETTLNTGKRGVLMFNQPISETKVLSEKVEELEGVQALERDRFASVQKTMESKMDGLENLLKTLLSQSQASVGHGDFKGNGGKHHEHHGSPVQKWGKTSDNDKCFYCGKLGHFQADCDEMKGQILTGNIKVNPEGKLRLKDGAFIPNYPPGATIKERVERHYSKKPSQLYYGEYEEDHPVPSSAPRYPAQFLHLPESADRRRARLEKELDLLEKEEALELKRMKLERDEKKRELANGSSRATNVVDLLGPLTDDEVAAIRQARAGFP